MPDGLRQVEIHACPAIPRARADITAWVSRLKWRQGDATAAALGVVAVAMGAAWASWIGNGRAEGADDITSCSVPDFPGSDRLLFLLFFLDVEDPIEQRRGH